MWSALNSVITDMSVCRLGVRERERERERESKSKVKNMLIICVLDQKKFLDNKYVVASTSKVQVLSKTSMLFSYFTFTTTRSSLYGFYRVSESDSASLRYFQ